MLGAGQTGVLDVIVGLSMKIGVVGSRGRLGAIMMRTLERQDGVDAIAIGASPVGLDAVINAAPLRDAAFHRLALDSGCHVIDVTIDLGLIQEMLALDAVARQQGRCLVAMAGLSPGLTGLLAREMLTRFTSAEYVQVSLLQNTAGTAGEQGTREMIDLLTRPECHFEKRPYRQRIGSPPSVRRLFDLDSPELEFLDEAAKMQFVTGFDSRIMNAAIYTLALVRRAAPPIYTWLRDTIARRKARAGEAAVENIELGALALTRNGAVLAGRLIRLASDYGVTAAISCAAASLAVRGLAHAGAGHLSDFVALDTLLDQPIVKTQILDESSSRWGQ
jgi:hypothetical protein